MEKTYIVSYVMVPLGEVKNVKVKADYREDGIFEAKYGPILQAEGTFPFDLWVSDIEVK